MSTAFTLLINQIIVLQRKKILQLCDNERRHSKKKMYNKFDENRTTPVLHKQISHNSFDPELRNPFFGCKWRETSERFDFGQQITHQNCCRLVVVIVSVVVACCSYSYHLQSVFIYWQIFCVPKITFTQNQLKIAAKSKITVEKTSFDYVNSK